MNDEDNPAEILGDAIELALAHTPIAHRRALRLLFEFDARLARIIAGTTEPMLGQVRLAWWRETLAAPIAGRPGGDPVLAGAADYWAGNETSLIALVDGWEHLLTETPLEADEALGFANGRARAFGGFAELAGCHERSVVAAQDATRIWAIADACAHVSDETEREMMLELGAQMHRPARLPAPLRGIAVLGSLGRRALDAGGRPLMSGRGAAITAARAALFGR